ncbi:MAG: DUF5677 domain-containing protein [Bacteroidota bacterium]
MTTSEQIERELTSIISRYHDKVHSELQDRWNNWNIDLEKKEIKEVVCGILSRQVSIVINYSSSPNLWNGDMAPIILRCMADNYINLAWILKGPEERSRKFILHGLGQAKLAMEHRKKQLKNDGHDPEGDSFIRTTEMWINAQRHTFLTEVNLGSWSELNTRKMAEEAGCIDFYNLVYQPFSTASHNMWNHISRYNLIPSDNPLHMFLMKPIVVQHDPELEYLELGAKYLSKMFKLFDETFNHFSKDQSSFKLLSSELNRIFNELNKDDSSTTNTGRN